MKKYIEPSTTVYRVITTSLLSGSGQGILDSTKNDQTIEPTKDPFNGEFGTKRYIWDYLNGE